LLAPVDVGVAEVSCGRREVRPKGHCRRPCRPDTYTRNRWLARGREQRWGRARRDGDG
jgi:hypothetical protein